MSKEKAVATILWAAQVLGVPEASPDGSERISGHTLRVTGAQGLAVSGWNLWAVQLMGRWGSETIRGYLREAPLAALLTASPALSVDIDEIVTEVVRRLRARPAPAKVAEVTVPDSVLQDLPPAPLSDPAPLLRAEIARVHVPEGPKTALRNDRSGILHILAGDGHARCGWAFSNRPHTILSEVPARDCGAWCQNCWPTRRGSADASDSD